MSERGRARLVLRPGVGRDYDGAYNWVNHEDFDDPAYSVGEHEGTRLGDWYQVVEMYSRDDTRSRAMNGEDFTVEIHRVEEVMQVAAQLSDARPLNPDVAFRFVSPRPGVGDFSTIQDAIDSAVKKQR